MLLLLLTACIDDVGKDKTKAIVEDVPAEVVERAAGQTWAVDATSSKIGALGAKVTKAFPLVFHEFEGEVTSQGGDVTGVSFTVQMASVTSPHDKLTAHLLNEDFFWADKYPVATFASSTVAAGSDAEGQTHTVTGNLEIRGKTKQITFPAHMTVSDDNVTATTEFTIDRNDFDVIYAGQADDLIQDNVVLTVSLVAPKS